MAHYEIVWPVEIRVAVDGEVYTVSYAGGKNYHVMPPDKSRWHRFEMTHRLSNPSKSDAIARVRDFIRERGEL